MTTTTQPPTATDTGDELCPKCKIPLNHVEGTNVVNCNTCGYTGESAVTSEPTTQVPHETIQPDEVLGAGEHKPTPEVPEPEAVDHNAMLEHAVESAMSSPGVPGRDEFLTLAQTARMLAMSPLVPKFLRNNPAACFHLAMIGRDLGISPTSAVEQIDIMPDDRNDFTKGGRPMLSPELLNGQIIRLALGSIVPLVKERDRCIAVALAPGGALDRTCIRLGRHFYKTKQDYIDLGYIGGNDTMADVPEYALALPMCGCQGIVGETTFTWADAIDAELVSPLCVPGNHKKVTKQRRNGNGTYETCGCNQGYITYPKQMMWWRASGFCQTENFPQASLGLYTAEAMGALVDSTGRMIDPATVALPEGYEPTEAPASRGAASGAPIEREPASDTERANVAGRIGDLPPEQQTSLKTMWTEKQREHRVESVAKLTKPGLRVAMALLDTAEREARAKGWEPTFVPLTEPTSEDQGPGTPDPGPQPAPTEAPASQDPPQGGTDDAQAPPPGPEPSQDQVTPTDAPAEESQVGRERPILTEAHMTSAIAIVKMMSPKQLNDALRSRSLDVKGTADQRGARLAQAFAREAAQADWSAANPNPGEGEVHA